MSKRDWTRPVAVTLSSRSGDDWNPRRDSGAARTVSSLVLSSESNAFAGSDLLSATTAAGAPAAPAALPTAEIGVLTLDAGADGGGAATFSVEATDADVGATAFAACTSRWRTESPRFASASAEGCAVRARCCMADCFVTVTGAREAVESIAAVRVGFGLATASDAGTGPAELGMAIRGALTASAKGAILLDVA